MPNPAKNRPDFESLYRLADIARKQGCLEWAYTLENQIHTLERVFSERPRFCSEREVEEAFDAIVV